MNNPGERIGIIGIAMNFLISTPKIILGILTQSISLFTDGINNACDSITGIITYIGIKISKKPKDIEHPYGHGRAEYIAGFLIALFTAFVGIQFFISSCKNLLYPKTPDLNSTARIILIVSIILKLFFAYINNIEYKKYHSTLFKANRQDAIMDVITSIFILISSFFFKGHAWLDSVLGIIISILILYQAWETLKDTLTPLVGPSPSQNDIYKVTDALKKSKLINNIHNIYLDRQSMCKVIATADIEVNPNITIQTIHDEIEKITNNLKKETNIELIVHVEPIITDKKMLEIKEQLLQIEGITGVHDLLLINENYVTIEIDRDKLKIKDQILKKALNILEKEDEKKWNIENIVSFKKKIPME